MIREPADDRLGFHKFEGCTPLLILRRPEATPEKHRVTEIAIYHHDGMQITDHYKTLINPGRKIPHFITGLTGINYEMVKEAPSFADVAEEVMGWLKDRVFVAHNAHFDYSFLRKEFEDTGLAWNTKKLCTVRLSRKIIPGLDSYGLGRLAESLGIKIPDRHRAGGDALATARIFDILLKRDQGGVIAKALRRNSGEAILPPNLPKEEFDKLPARPGVYYFPRRTWTRDLCRQGDQHQETYSQAISPVRHVSE
ncbi:MAG: 3'-5' exonuclease [Bacteroidota bacterium]